MEDTQHTGYEPEVSQSIRQVCTDFGLEEKYLTCTWTARHVVATNWKQISRISCFWKQLLDSHDIVAPDKHTSPNHPWQNKPPWQPCDANAAYVLREKMAFSSRPTLGAAYDAPAALFDSMSSLIGLSGHPDRD
ncbi:hypothetical protein V1264_018824 [Littorina saxatilis]|uniref:Uncharacterized protein n=1 Tax=Littorina saxatilis TaxID=31220 RepID=A0AAN9BDK2_9CAEN